MTLGQDSRSYRIRMLLRMCLFRCKDNAFSRLPGAAKQHGCLLTQIHLNPHWQSNVIIQRREKCAAGCQDNQVAAPAAAVCLAEVFIFPIFIFHSFFFFIAPEDFIAARDGIIPIDIFMHGSSNEMEIFGVAWLAGICLSPFTRAWQRANGHHM